MSESKVDIHGDTCVHVMWDVTTSSHRTCGKPAVREGVNHGWLCSKHNEAVAKAKPKEKK
jgi:hypothetical protein